MIRRRSRLLLASVVVAIGCDNVRDPSGPIVAPPTAKISDGRFSGGNDDFFFLPPLLPNPVGTANYNAGAFNGQLRPTVQVCELDANPLITSTADCAVGTDGSAILVASFGPDQINVSVTDEQYAVNWNTSASNLVVDRFYRLQVFLGSVRIGFADIDPVSSGRDLKNVNTGQAIPLLDGRTLPVKFRIENGALCTNKADCAEFTVTNEVGGTFVTNTADAGIRFLPGFLPAGVEEITVRIERVVVGPDNRCHGAASARLWREFEGCYEITSDPDLRRFGGIQQPAIAGQCVEISETDPLYDFLQPYKSNNGGELVRLASAEAPFLDCEGFSGSPTQIGQASNPLVRFAAAGLRRVGDRLGPIFGVRTLNAIDLGLGEELPVGTAFSRFGWAIGLEAETTGSDQTTGFGLPTPQPLEVHLTSLHFHSDPDGEIEHEEDVAGVPVLFAVTEGDGYFELAGGEIPVRTKQVLTNADGRAVVSFTAASNGPTNVVTATSPTLDTESQVAVFSIGGLPPDLVIENVQRTPAVPTPYDPLRLTFSVRNAGQGVAVPSVVRVALSVGDEITEPLGSIDVPVGRLDPGQSVSLATPDIPPPWAPGSYNAMVMANATLTAVEASDKNNTALEYFAVPSRVGCEREPSARSFTGATPTSILFTNRTTQSVSVYWLDYQGQRVLYTVLEAGAEYLQQTFLTHPWIVVGADETCYGISLPARGPTSVIVP